MSVIRERSDVRPLLADSVEKLDVEVAVLI
jgi:hypothetical protein